MSHARVLGRVAKLACFIGVLVPAWTAFGQSQSPPPFVSTPPYSLMGVIPSPAPDKITSFDISWVDPVRHRYYLANRTSEAIIVVDTMTNTIVSSFKPGFKGFTGNNDNSGPDGVLTTENELYVGDAPSQVWALEPNTGAPITAPISTSATSPNRADEGCYDPVHKIVAFVNNADSPPFITFISTVTHSILGQVAFDGNGGRPHATNGAEQCQFNPRDNSIYLSIPEIDGGGDNSSPGGVVRFDPVTREILNVYIIPLASCTGPQGLAIGPAPQIGLGCNVGVISGSPAANTAIIEDSTGGVPGSVVHTFANMGGGDEIWYNPSNNKYFFAARSAPGGEALFIFDAVIFAAQRLFTGTLSNAHSVAVEPATNIAYVPTSSAATSHLCSLNGGVDANGCILLFAPHTENVVASHDFNGDNKSDILFVSNLQSGVVAGWLMNGATISQMGSIGTLPTGVSIIGQRDFNGNGKSDILLRNGTTGALSMWLMSGLQLLNAANVATVGTDWTVVGTADFNNDFNGDILWRQSTGAVAIWLMNGPAILSTAGLGTVTTDWTIVGTGDFNGDGNADILWRQNTGAVAIWFINGIQVVGTGGVAAVGADWTIVGTGDFNGDGKFDILWRHSSGAVAVWLMSGTQILQSASIGTMTTDWIVAETGDFNGDGKSDILWVQTSPRNNNNVAIWFMNGTQVSSAATVGSITPDWIIQGANSD